MIIDLTLLAILLAALITGGIKGLVKQLGTLVAFVVAVLCCRFFGEWAADSFVAAEHSNETLLRALCYICVFIFSYLAVILIAKLLHATVKAMKLGSFNAILGALFRSVLWMMVVSFVLNVYFAIVPSHEAQFIDDSKPWREIVLESAPTIVGFIGAQTAESSVIH